ncbi:MAG: O-phospho-L-seryl-tRNA:Cys-tRNA synthase [Candidatus Hadarchaeota archaeon]|nr:O-phospho-L-seryl-tRNA:Cys-tRNA synthase [Candidatus Hadarchaeota archaeon]
MIQKSRLDKYRNLSRDREEKYININPIQRGGVLTPEARKVLLEFGDGYSDHDYYVEERLDLVRKPPIRDFVGDLAEFLGMDEARVVSRCREAMYIVFKALTKPGYTIIIDALSHYSTYLAAEACGLRVKEIPNTGYPEFKTKVEKYREKIEGVKRDTGKPPALVLLTHADSKYGNLSDARAVGEIAHQYDVPFLLNAACTAGVMPVSGKSLGADFIVASGHKSWAASSPIGILALRGEHSERILAQSKMVGEISGRKFPGKEVGLLGSMVGGVPLLTLMASFPHVVERVKNWDEEVKKARFAVKELERIEGTKQLGVKPKEHTLIYLESEGFYRVSQKHKRKGWFLYDELRERSVVGVQPGLTKHFGINTYGLTQDQVKHVVGAFQEIAEKYKLEVK